MPDRRRRVVAALAGLLMTFSFAAAQAANLPSGFVYLSDIDPTIAQDIRYAGRDNFTHAPVPGYQTAECVLSKQTAQALAKVQSDLRAKGHGLLVYDCYRPAKAVRRFVEWASEEGGTDPVYHPNIPRNRLIVEGYIGRTSGHSSGGTVDLTLVRLSEVGHTLLPMGTAFDFFDPLASTKSNRIAAEARASRRLLVEAMSARGFRNYRREWWHFRYAGEPFAGRVFDFDILPKTR
jgi:D-alanyl-D-alanine dipeptidase